MGKMLVEQLVLRCPQRGNCSGRDQHRRHRRYAQSRRRPWRYRRKSGGCTEQKGETYYRPHWYPDS